MKLLQLKNENETFFPFDIGSIQARGNYKNLSHVMDFILVSRNLEVETESVKVPKKSERDKFQVLILGIGFILTTFLLLSHSCLSGRAGSTTNCVSAKPSWSNSAKRTYSRTTLMSWTTPAKWSSSW